MHIAARSKLAVIMGSITLLVTITACTSEEAFGPYTPEQTVEEFSGIDFDYDPVASPIALAEQSELVVTGTIDRVQEGRVQVVPGNEKLPGVSTIVLVLRDPVANSGKTEADSDGFVYIELPNPGDKKPQDYEDGLRTGSHVVAYLVRASDGAPAEGIDATIDDPSAGRPVGQGLYLPAGPQGLLIQYENEAVVWPLIGEQEDGKLEDSLPGGDLIAQ